MTDTFTWQPTSQATGTSTFAVRSAQFGDGYTQEVADGINNESQSWPLTFMGSKAEIQPIVDFFRAHAGYRGFWWTPPFGVQGIYKVTAFSPMPNGGDIYTLTATFVQKFAP